MTHRPRYLFASMMGFVHLRLLILAAYVITPRKPMSVVVGAGVRHQEGAAGLERGRIRVYE